MMDDIWLGKWRKVSETGIEERIDQLEDEYTLPYAEALVLDYKSIEYQTAIKNIVEGGIPEKIGFN